MLARRDLGVTLLAPAVVHLVVGHGVPLPLALGREVWQRDPSRAAHAHRMCGANPRDAAGCHPPFAHCCDGGADVGTVWWWGRTPRSECVHDDRGGMPAHGNQRALWDAGCRFDFVNPEYR